MQVSFVPGPRTQDTENTRGRSGRTDDGTHGGLALRKQEKNRKEMRDMWQSRQVM